MTGQDHLTVPHNHKNIKTHVTLKTGVMTAENSALQSQEYCILK